MGALHRKAWIPGQARNDGAKRVRAFGDERPGEARLLKVYSALYCPSS